MPPIVLITDFGTGSPYVAEMKGAILAMNANATIVDGTHDIPAQDIVAGAFVVKQLLLRFPEDTIFVVVVDPGVGTKRNILAIESQQRRLIGPDNGVLSLAADETTQSYNVDKPNYWGKSVSVTLHGRDIMGPVAAYLAAGIPMDQVATPNSSMPIRIDWPTPKTNAQEVVGEIVYIDSFGNLMTNIPGDLVRRNSNGVVNFMQRELPLVITYASRDSGSVVALISSSDCLEIAACNGNAQRLFAAKVGDSVTYRW